MPTFHRPVVDNQIIVIVTLSCGPGEKRYSFNALLDTGSQITAISPNVVAKLGLVPIGEIGLTVANGQTVPTFQYRARVEIPIQFTQAVPKGGSDNFFMGNELFVAGLTYEPNGYDVLLGMDLLGIFHVTIHGNRIIMSN